MQLSTSSWLRFLSEKHLIPHTFDQTDWSGRGQHAEFDSDEDALVGELLQAKGVIGHTASAVVEKVQCRRIIFARKTIRCNRRLKREEAIEEVAHLQRLSHAHVIRGVGTYVLRKDLAILLYPATRHNLETFLDECVEFTNAKRLSLSQSRTLHSMLLNARRFFECLTCTLGFIHGRFVKHMDIKPSNMLVQDKGWRNDSYEYKIYIADFGISRSYAKAEDAETDSYTPFSRVYAAPEVIRQDQRGFSAGTSNLSPDVIHVFSNIFQIFSAWVVSSWSCLPSCAYLWDVMSSGLFDKMVRRAIILTKQTCKTYYNIAHRMTLTSSATAATNGSRRHGRWLVKFRRCDLPRTI
jgi:serine/threonine protein kinase